MGTIIELFIFIPDLKDLFGTFVCCGTPLLIIVMIILGMNKSANQRAEWLKQQRMEIEKAKTSYYESLEDLKLNPTNADLKQSTLRLGRTYSELTRQYEGYDGVTLFDEVALMNDINAACAGAMSSSINLVNSNSIETRLAKLSELKEKNIISEEEYEQRRGKIIDEI